MSLILLLVSALAAGAAVGHDEKLTFPDSAHRAVFISNPYPDQIKPTELCLYLYRDANKNACQKITEDHPYFTLKVSPTWSQIQRIIFRANSKSDPNEVLSCIAYQGNNPDTLDSLSKVTHATVEINYVGDHYIVCSLVNKF